MKNLFITCAILLFVFAACNNASNASKKDASNQFENTVLNAAERSIMQLDERLKNADSLVLVFYKDPHGADSLRYTRYYSEFHSTDTALIGLVKNSLQDTVQRVEKVKPCRSEGKIWCFDQGNIFQTIYFSSHSDACNFVYIIKNGQFYYSDMSKMLSAKLADIKPLAKESRNEGQ